MSRRPKDFHLRTRRKFELVIGDLRRALTAPDMDGRYEVLFHATASLYPFIEEVSRDLQKANLLIDVTRATRESFGAGRDATEERLMEHLDHVVRRCGDAFSAAGVDFFLEYPECRDCPPELEAPCAILRGICAYAYDCFAYTRPRDQFAGMRRAGAFQILGSAGWFFDLPAAVPLAALKRDRRLEARGALVFLEEYAQAREGVQMPDAVIEALRSFVERTDNRSNATGALNVCVVSGAISELDALFRLDDWKERHPWA